MHNPEFIVFCGPMWASKTTRLLATLERYKYQKKRIVAFKPVMDRRYDDSRIVSHVGMTLDARPIVHGSEMMGVLSEEDETPDVVAVDEAFMIPGVAENLIWLYRNTGMTVLVSTLDLSSSGTPFEEVVEMLPWASRVEKCSAVCTVCGLDAYYTHKKAVSENEIEVGGTELYEPRCWRHSLAANLSGK